MIPRNPASSRGPSTQYANSLDARTAAGSLQAKRCQAALMNVANAHGLTATSATSAAIMLRDIMETKARLREDILRLKDMISEDEFPTDFIFVNAAGTEVAITLTSKEEAQALMDVFEQRLEALSDVQSANAPQGMQIATSQTKVVVTGPKGGIGAPTAHMGTKGALGRPLDKRECDDRGGKVTRGCRQGPPGMC